MDLLLIAMGVFRDILKQESHTEPFPFPVRQHHKQEFSPSWSQESFRP